MPFSRTVLIIAYGFFERFLQAFRMFSMRSIERLSTRWCFAYLLDGLSAFIRQTPSPISE
jgi:hypothetical protein